MQLIATDILEDARGFSTGVLMAAFAVGFLIWLLGWRSHRFWIVLATTVGAGIIGLQAGPAYGMRPLVAGLLLAVALGGLALALVRVIAFAAGGLTAWAVVHALAPAWNEPIVSFLVGGLVSLVLFKVWTMALTSAAGTLFMMYSGLCLAHKLGNVDVMTWAENQGMLLNIACVIIAFVGLVIQFLLHRGQAREQHRREMRRREDPRDYDHGGWWGRGQRAYRRAG